MNTKKRTLKIFNISLVIVIIISSLLAFVGCNKNDTKNKYNAEVVATDIYKFNKEFAKENYTYGAMYDAVNMTDIEENESLPETRTIVVENGSALQKIFFDFPQTDFEREMIIIYGYTAVDHKEDKIACIELSGNKLQIKFGYQTTDEPNAPDASLPYTKWIVIKMNCLEFKELELIHIGGMR